MDYWEHPREFLEGKSSNRIESVKPPKQSWRGRARCFRLFDDNLKPSDISPRQCGVSRRTLYRYEDYKLLRAKRVLGRLIAKEQDEAKKLEAQRKQAEYEAKQRDQRQREYEQREQVQRQQEQQERERKASESTQPPEYTWPFSARR